MEDGYRNPYMFGLHFWTAVALVPCCWHIPGAVKVLYIALFGCCVWPVCSAALTLASGWRLYLKLERQLRVEAAFDAQVRLLVEMFPEKAGECLTALGAERMETQDENVRKMLAIVERHASKVNDTKCEIEEFKKNLVECAGTLADGIAFKGLL